VTAWTPEQIAAVCHDANRRLQFIHGDPAPSVPWECETDEIRQSAIAGVNAVLAGATPDRLHEEWCRNKAAAGWRRGAFKDPLLKTHPSLAPYAELPAGERVKDAVFAAIVRAMSGQRPPLLESLAADLLARCGLPLPAPGSSSWTLEDGTTVTVERHPAVPGPGGCAVPDSLALNGIPGGPESDAGGTGRHGEGDALNAGLPAAWTGACPPGGMVCAVPGAEARGGVCGYPVESEPCPVHRDPEWRPE